MSEFWVKKLLKQSEGHRLEFKESRAHLPSTLFETVCAFLNREGGDIHREYTNAYPARVIIYNDRVEFENASVPHGEGPLTPESFTPFPRIRCFPSSSSNWAVPRNWGRAF